MTQDLILPRLQKVMSARSSLRDYMELAMPDPSAPQDADKSRYITAPHHARMDALLESVESGETLRAAIIMPPRMGKSQKVSKGFPTWFWGKDPYRQIILGSYSQGLAEKFGRNNRDFLQSSIHRQVFPNFKLDDRSRAADRMETTDGGVSIYVGRGGAITGFGADLLIIDDPLANREEAESPGIRNKLWEWYWDVAYTRLMPGGRVVICMTRWHEDDLLGRLLDPKNDFYNPEEAARWTVLHLPALNHAGESLWPERYSAEYLNQIKATNPRGFYALYQGEPAPEDGDYFKREWVRTYRPDDLPKNLRVYAASDHAVSTAQNRDATCCVVVGVDEDSNIYVLDCWWEKKETDDVVEAMLMLMRQHNPITWWAERGHISKSIGPFLRKRMEEEKTYIALDEQTPIKDKQTRAQSIKGRMAMGKVYFPAHAPWFPEALDELLKFPNGRNDDFVDSLAHIGLGLGSLNSASRPAPKLVELKTGTLGWIKQTSKTEKKKARLIKLAGGM